MNPDTATIDECIVYISDAMDDYPLSATLDAAAGALPEGWVWTTITSGAWNKLGVKYVKQSSLWHAACWRDDDQNDASALADTEHLARFRAAAKAWMQVKGEA